MKDEPAKRCPSCGCTGDKITLVDLEWDTDGEKKGLLYSCDECSYGWPADGSP